MADDPTTRPRGRPKTFDRSRTLETAIDSYWRHDFDAVSVNEICRRAGVSKPGLYREFGNEDQLMDAVLTRYSERVLGPVMATLAEDRPFRETLNALIEFVTREETPETPAGCLFVKMRSLRWRLGPITREHVDRLRDQTVAAYAAWLERATRRDEISLPASLDATARYVDAQFTMLLTLMAAGEDPIAVRTHAALAFSVLTNPIHGE